MILHTVCFTLAHAPGSDEEQTFLDDARRILPAIPGVEEFTASRQVGEQSDFRFQFAMRFASRDAYAAYDAHPDHQGFVAERWEAEVAAFQEFDFVPLEG